MYNMAMLSKIINTADAMNNFADTQEYFDKITAFVNDSNSYLSEFAENPLNALSSKESREIIMTELDRIHKTLLSLGITNVSSEVSDIRSAVLRDDIFSFTTSLIEFKDIISFTAEHIKESKEQKTPSKTSGGKQIILAVDDRPEVLTTVVNILTNRYTVMAVTDGTAALKVIERHLPVLFLLDIEMPGMDGYELAKIIRSHDRFKRTPIIFLTGKNSRKNVISAAQTGVNDYILKPVEKEKLIKKISQHLANL